MRAVVYREYGSADVVRVEDIPNPVLGDSQILVRTHASTVSTAEVSLRQGQPLYARLVTGLRRPRRATIPGSELAGEVTAVGGRVGAVEIGERIVASTGASLGATAEYVVLPQDGAFARIPGHSSYEDAVAVCEGGLTALPFLRDGGSVRSGERVLINGASGAVGVAAVQLAKQLGAHVTGVSGPSSQDLVRSLGADAVLDYRREDFTTAEDRYDVVFDVASTSSFDRSRRILRHGGRYLRTVPSVPIVLQTLWTSRFGDKRAKVMLTGLRPSAAKSADLRALMALLESAAIRPIVGQRFSIENAAEAHRYVEGGTKQGSVVIATGPFGA